MQKSEKRAVTNQDTTLLGIIAIVAMLFDHAGVTLFPRAGWMRVVGRLALPLFAWGIAVGAEHTRNLRRYQLRLLALLVISQPFYAFGLNNPMQKLNIFAVLLLGLIAIEGLKEKKEWKTVAALLLSQLVPMDYGLRGVLCILLLWALRDKPLALAVCFSAYCVVWGETSSSIWTTPYFTLRLQTAAISALPLILWPRDRRTKLPGFLPRYSLYAVYPLHIAILWALKALLA